MVDGPNMAPLLATTTGKGGGGRGGFLLQPLAAFVCGLLVLLATLGFFYWEIVTLEVRQAEERKKIRSPVVDERTVDATLNAAAR